MRNFFSHNFASYFAPFRFYGARSGLSVLELLIFSAIFTLVMLGFVTVLVSVVNVNARQGAAAEVNGQSQFLLEQIKYYVERSSLVELAQDVATSTLRLRMRAPSEDPTLIYLADGIMYLKASSSAATAITTSKVTLSNVSFTKRSNPPGKDSVDVNFTVAYTTTGVKDRFVRSLDTAIARVSAATFDSDVFPSSTDAYALGTGPLRWDSINGVIYFSDANPPSVSVGVNSFGTNVKLRVSGGNIYTSDSPTDLTGGNLVMRDPGQSYCWYYKPTTVTGAWSISSSTCP
ncbi:MAG: hypothetical protein AAB897_04160 [Patescibacteria group bacterium]